MSTYERREVTHVRVEFVVPAADPWGADWVEVTKAINAAIAELRDTSRLATHEEPSADAIRVRPTDDAVIVSYQFALEEVSS